MTPYYSEGGVTIYHGDCRDVLPTLAGVSAIVTDPPYGISVAGSVSIGPRGSRNLDFFDGDDPQVGIDAVRLALAALNRPGSVVVWLGHRQVPGILDVLHGAGMTTKPLAWVKECPVPAAPGMRWTSGFELGIYGFDEGSYFADRGAGMRPNVFRVDGYRYGQPGKVEHPTQKPLTLITENVRAVVPPGDLVLDPFAGSGTTLVAARQLGRRAIGIEIEERYCEIAAKRLAQGALPLWTALDAGEVGRG